MQYQCFEDCRPSKLYTELQFVLAQRTESVRCKDKSGKVFFKKMIGIDCDNHTIIRKYVMAKLQIFIVLQKVVHIFTTEM